MTEIWTWLRTHALCFYSHPYMTTRKTITLTIRTFVGKVISLFFNILSTFVMAFLPRSKHLLISWLQYHLQWFLEPKKIMSVTVSIFSPSIFHEVMGPDAMILVFECWVLSQLFHSALSFSLSDHMRFFFVRSLGVPWWPRSAMQETWVQSLSWGDPLEKEMATHSSTLA